MKNNETPKLVEVIKVTTGDFHQLVSFQEHDLPEGALQILIRFQYVSKLSFICLRHDTIRSLKVKIFDKTRIAPRRQKLFFAGVELIDNHRTFSDYNIPCRSTIDLVEQHITQIRISVGPFYCMMPMFVDTRTTVKRVKALFRYEKGISTDQLRLVYAGRELQDSRTLAYYYVKYGEFLRLVDDRTWMRGVFQIIYVMTSTGKRFHLRVNSLCTINDLKAKIQDHEGIPAHVQTLFLPQKRLQDGSTLVDNYIEHETFIYCLFSVSLEGNNIGGPK